MFKFKLHAAGKSAAILIALACSIASPAVGDELHYLPDGANVVVIQDIAAFDRSETGKALSKTVKQGVTSFRVKDCDFGIPEIERMSSGAVLPSDKIRMDFPQISVVTSKKPIDAAKVKMAMSAEGPGRKEIEFKQVKVGKHTVYRESHIDRSISLEELLEPREGKTEQPGEAKTGEAKTPARVEGDAFCVVEQRVLIVGDWPSVRRALERGKPAVPAANIRAALKEEAVSGDLLIVVADARPLIYTLRMELFLFFGKGDGAAIFPGAETLRITARENGKLNLSAAMVFKDAASAADGRKTIEKSLASIKTFVSANIAEDQKATLVKILDAIFLHELASGDGVPSRTLRAALALEPTQFAEFPTEIRIDAKPADPGR